MRPGVECAHARRVQRPGREGSGDAEQDERDRCTGEPRRGSCPWAAHEGGTVPHKTLTFADFVRSRTAEVLWLPTQNCSTFPHVVYLRLSETPASLPNLCGTGPTPVRLLQEMDGARA